MPLTIDLVVNLTAGLISLGGAIAIAFSVSADLPASQQN